jgi:hypothetical protein
MKIKINEDVPRDYWYSSISKTVLDVVDELPDSYYIKYNGFVERIDKDHCILIVDSHYDNSKGSLYKFASDHDLNAYEFDIIKRIVRCRKKGHFKEDLEKTKRVIDLYLNENE